MSKSSQTLGIIGALSCVASTGIGFGLSLPLLSFVMKQLGYAPWIIGLNTAMPALAAFLFAPLFLKLLEKQGIGKFIFISIFFSILFFMGFFFTENLIVWFILRFLFGACLDGTFVASETWAGELASNATRGKIMGLFSSCLSIGYFSGAGLLTLTGTHGIFPFLMGSFVFFLVIFPVIFTKNHIPNIKSEQSSAIKPIILSTPIAMGAALVYGYLESTAFNLLPLFALANKLSEQKSIFLLVIVGGGQACLQFFIGAIADRFSEKTSLFLCTLTGILGVFGIYFFIHTSFALYFILFFWGASISGFYTLALIIVGNKYQGSSLAAANSAVVAMFGFGSLIGPPISGIGLTLSERVGFLIALLLPVVIFFFMLLKPTKKVMI